ncbi:MAG: zinc-dependent alcohol dehydrogenase family protein [Planctomycetes bacterium]|nr:zinc-dependent alcohol dehydrogenase family protein [Planctomycetota bacterium]
MTSSSRHRAMVLRAFGEPLEELERPSPRPAPGEPLLRVRACGLCRTDLHLVDGELPNARLPVVPGHQIVGEVIALGEGTAGPALGSRVGVTWLASTCGSCPSCRGGRENLCDVGLYTGHDRDGGFAEQVLARADFCLPLPETIDDLRVAPLLCAGAIGWRSLRFAGPAERIGLYGFGAAAHLLAQIIRAQGREFYAFTRTGDGAAQELARELGASWAGSSDETPPRPLDAALIFAPVGALVPRALRAVGKGGRVVCGGIHMSDIPSIPYRDLWEERSLQSVANLTRDDARELLDFAADHRIEARVTRYPLAAANEAIEDLRRGRITGATVLCP